MKKILKFLPVALIGLLVAPVATSLSSCSYSTSLQFKYLDFVNTQGDKYKDVAKTPSVSLDELLYGTTKVNKGNYALMIGSAALGDSTSTHSATYDLLFSGGVTPTYDIANLSVTSQVYNAWMQSTSDYTDLKNGVSFFTFLDIKAYVTGDDSGKNDVIGAYDKWTEDDEKDAQGNKTGHKKDTYKRVDGYAKTYRHYQSLIKSLFNNFSGDADTIPDNNIKPYFIFWKEGKPKAASSSCTTTQSIIDKMDKVYKPDESSKS